MCFCNYLYDVSSIYPEVMNGSETYSFSSFDDMLNRGFTIRNINLQQHLIEFMAPDWGIRRYTESRLHGKPVCLLPRTRDWIWISQ